jgi:hypothetical protein
MDRLTGRVEKQKHAKTVPADVQKVKVLKSLLKKCWKIRRLGAGAVDLETPSGALGAPTEDCQHLKWERRLNSPPIFWLLILNEPFFCMC